MSEKKLKHDQVESAPSKIKNASDVEQFSYLVSDGFQITGSGDTTVSFNSADKRIIITSSPGAGGGGAVTSFNGRTGGVVSTEGDYSLNLLGDVNINTPLNNDTIFYNTSTLQWENKPVLINHNDTLGIQGGSTGDYLHVTTNERTIWNLNSASSYLQFDNVSSFRALSLSQKNYLLNGTFKGVQLNGYYSEGDTPNPIIYNITSSLKPDDAGSIFEIQGLKFEHKFTEKSIDIRYFGIINNNSIDQSTKLDAHAKYCDENDIYEIDYNYFDILTSKTILYTSTRGSKHSGITFRKAHKIKNLTVRNDQSVTLYQGNKLIQFVPTFNPTTETVFELENVVFDPYNPNFTIVDGEADGYMMGFAAFVQPSTWVRTSGVATESNWSFSYNNVKFISPAVSYNIATADIFAKNITLNNVDGDYWGLFYFFLSKYVYFDNFKGVFRDDLHTGSGRLLVTNLAHVETEIGTNTVTLADWYLSNLKCTLKTTGLDHVVFKAHNIGTHNFGNVFFENCQGNVDFFSSDTSKMTVNNIVAKNITPILQLNCFFNKLTVNDSVFRFGNTFLTSTRATALPYIEVNDSELTGALCFSGGVRTDITTIKFNRVKLPTDATNGIARTSNFVVNNMYINDCESRSQRLFEATVENLYIDGLQTSLSSIDNFCFFRDLAGFTNTRNVEINNLKFANVPQNVSSSFFTLSAGITLNYKKLTNSFTHSRIGSFDYEGNVYPMKRGTTALRPTNLDTTKIGTEYYDTTINRPIYWNGTAWVDALNTSSGTYTVTFVAVANVSSVTSAGLASWIKIGNIVSVTIPVNITPTASTTTTTFTATMPINRATSSSINIGSGTLTSSSGFALYPARVLATATNAVTVNYIPTNTSIGTGTITFQYDITQ